MNCNNCNKNDFGSIYQLINSYGGESGVYSGNTTNKKNLIICYKTKVGNTIVDFNKKVDLKMCLNCGNIQGIIIKEY